MATKNRIVEAYDDARDLVRKREGRELSPREFLNTVAPGAEYDEKSGRDFMRRLRKGDTSGERLLDRIRSVTGRNVRVDYKVGRYVDPSTGEIIDDIRSQNVTVPYGKTGLDFYRDDVRGLIDEGLRDSYSRRTTTPARKNDPTYVPLAALPKDAVIVGLHRSKRPRRHAVVLFDTGSYDRDRQSERSQR